MLIINNTSSDLQKGAFSKHGCWKYQKTHTGGKYSNAGYMLEL